MNDFTEPAPHYPPPAAGVPGPRPAAPPRRWTRWLGGVVAIAVLVLAVRWLWRGEAEEEEGEAPAAVVSVRTARVETGALADEYSALGVVAPRQSAVVSAKVSSVIQSMALLKNRTVKAGEVLAVLESADLRAQRAEAAAALEEARQNLRLLDAGSIPETDEQDAKAVRDARASEANARATYERRRALFAQDGISRRDLEASQLDLARAESELKLAENALKLHHDATNPGNRALAETRLTQARERLSALDTQLGYAVIRAPFAGVVTDQFQFQGEYASAGAKLFTLADLSEVIVKVPLPDTVASLVKAGDPARVIPQESPGETLNGTISLVSRSSDPQSRTVEAWVSLKDEGARLRADSAARVVLTTRNAPAALSVPTAAVTLESSNASEGVVMVVDDRSVAHETRVTVGIRTPERTQVLSGLKAGQTVVVEGNYALPDGTTVETRAPAAPEKGEANKEPEKGKQP